MILILILSILLIEYTLKPNLTTQEIRNYYCGIIVMEGVSIMRFYR